MKIKNLKREARKRLKRNYWSSVFICLLSIFLVGTSSLTIRVIETRNLQVVSPFFDLTHNNSSNSAIITTIYHTITSEDSSVDLNETFHVTRGVFDVIFDVLTDALEYIFTFDERNNGFIYGFCWRFRFVTHRCFIGILLPCFLCQCFRSRDC